MQRTGVVIVAHGSRGELGSAEIRDTLQRLADGVRPLLDASAEVTGASMQFNHPTLEEAVDAFAAKNVTRLVIMPYFLFPGVHITQDIPGSIGRFQDKYPAVEFVMAKPFGLGKTFASHVADCIIDAAPELSPSGTAPAPGDIERLSLDIVEKLLPFLPDLDEKERAVVKRLVHTSGDPEMGHLVRFSPDAVSSGTRAITGGAPIFTDVRMAASGINRRLADTFGCRVSCALDEAYAETSPTLTRTEQAIQSLGGRLGGSIVVVGNAPTALLALLDIIDHRNIRPALVIGMPVGFIRAAASKQELTKRNFPYITIIGTRGGSAVAAATVNALLKLAWQGNPSVR